MSPGPVQTSESPSFRPEEPQKIPYTAETFPDEALRIRQKCFSGKHLIKDWCDEKVYYASNSVAPFDRVDEFEIGTPQKGEQGRSKSAKKMRVVIAFEYRNGKSGRGYAKIISDYSAESLRPIFETHISKNASVLADGWSGYKPLNRPFSKPFNN